MLLLRVSSPDLLLLGVGLELLLLLRHSTSKLREILVIVLQVLIRLTWEGALVVDVVVRVKTRHFSLLFVFRTKLTNFIPSTT